MTEGKLWGGRFTEAPDRAAWELGRSVHFDERLWPYDIAGSRAHADELLRLELLTLEDHAAISGALDVIQGEFEAGTFAFQADDEDLHGALERRLVTLCGEAGGRLRAGRSRNDQICNDLRLYLRDAIALVTDAVRELQASLADKAEEVLDWLAPGYTHLQRAQPVTAGHHLMAHAWGLQRDLGRLEDAARRMDTSVLGSGALAGVTLGLDPARYASALGFDRAAENSMDAVADRDFAVEFLAAAAMLGVHLSRLGEEIVLWSSTEFGWVRVGDAFSTGSSIMPQKRNPDIAELVRGKSGRLVGSLVSLLVTLKGLPLTYNRDLQEDKEPVFDAVDTLALALPAMSGMVRSMTFDREVLRSSAHGGFSLATDLAEALVQAGVVFREAHERVGAFVSECERRGLELDEVKRKNLLATFPELEDAPLDLLRPDAAVTRRNATLGPAPDALRAQLAGLRELINLGS